MTNEEFIKSISLEGEEWRDVVGYEGYYMVSNKGRVCSFHVRNNPKIMLLSKAKRWKVTYLVVGLTNGKQHRRMYLHRLVAETFIQNPNNHKEIDHIDRNGLNNCVENLIWCTHKANLNNPNTRRLMSLSQRGIKQPTKWLAVVKLLNNNVIKVYDNITSVCKDGHLPSGVVNVLKGKSKSHHGYNWMYLSDYEKSLVNQ